ncbi:predicted protein [Nematostella vectensis]|uniref:F5/8 type C domain-containing protein n=1 Tax=Nematostella vectensis TaxID=45351 RepID=A7RRK6_NEMVE|nr:predicted protein [Nematostella vectensis]|eukprot:XP_001637840.1 predicted protein [Nematostella vectensis]
MRTWIWLIFAFFALNIGRKQVLAEDCRKANFGAVQEDKVLTGAVLATYAVFSEFECRVKCYTNHECLSVNLGPQVNGLRQCELNGAINDEETVLQSKMGFMYRGFKSVSLLQFYSALFCSFIFHVGLFGLRGWLNKSSGRLFESGRLFAMQREWSLEVHPVECWLKCLDFLSCFSINTASSPDSSQVWCELLAKDKYNASDTFDPNNHTSHHFNIPECKTRQLSKTTRSSFYSRYSPPYEGRLHKKYVVTKVNGFWQHSVSKADEFLQVDLLNVIGITGVATQVVPWDATHIPQLNYWVTRYGLHYSIDGAKWTTYPQADELIRPRVTSPPLGGRTDMPQGFKSPPRRAN